MLACSSDITGYVTGTFDKVEAVHSLARPSSEKQRQSGLCREKAMCAHLVLPFSPRTTGQLLNNCTPTSMFSTINISCQSHAYKWSTSGIHAMATMIPANGTMGFLAVHNTHTHKSQPLAAHFQRKVRGQIGTSLVIKHVSIHWIVWT